MASTVGALMCTGRVVSTNAVLEIRVTQFKPRMVVVTNRTSLASVTWSSSMDDDSAFKTVAAGTRTLEASSGVTPLDPDSAGNPGFSLGALADVNDTTTEELDWVAFS